MPEKPNTQGQTVSESSSENRIHQAPRSEPSKASEEQHESALDLNRVAAEAPPKSQNDSSDSQKQIIQSNLIKIMMH